MKVSVSAREEPDRELGIMQALSAAGSGSLGHQHLIAMEDSFQLHGPNGTHDCFVLEIVGPNIPDVVAERFGDTRLPGWIAKRAAKQALLGLEFLHKQGIAHGGL